MADLSAVLIRKLIKKLLKPTRVIGTNYLHRWHLIPHNRFCNIYLHKFIGSDDDRALHDHPWASVSFLLKGELAEVVIYQHDDPHVVMCKPLEIVQCVPWLRPVFRRATFAHRLVVIDGPVWTLFITGPKVREWGFLTKDGWKHWRTLYGE